MKNIKKITFLLLLIANLTSLMAQNKSADLPSEQITYITGKIDNSQKRDTLSLILHGPFFYDNTPEKGAVQTLTTIPNQKGEFKFKIITGNSPFHISLFLSSKRDNKFGMLVGEGDIADFVIQPADSINIIFDKQNQYFSGKGAALFEAQYKVVHTDKGRNILRENINDSFNNNTEKWLQQKDSILNAQLDLLGRYRSKISPVTYAIVRADIIGVNRAFLYRMIGFAGPFFSEGLTLAPEIAKVCQELERRPAYIDLADRASLSPKYIDYLYKKMVSEIQYNRIIKNINPDLDRNYFPIINKTYTGVLRDKLLALWLTRMVTLNVLKAEYLEAALSVMQTPAFITMAEEYKAIFTKGQPLVDFDFKDSKGKIVHLADFKGKVLLIDLWFSGCGGCVAVAAGLPQVEEAFKNRADVVFVSISVDKDKQEWLRSIDKNPTGKHYTHYTTPTTTYLYTSGTAGFNPFIKRYVPGGAYPSLLIIDKQSKIFSSIPSKPWDEKGRKNLITEIGQALKENN